MLLFTISFVCFSPVIEAGNFSSAGKKRVRLRGDWKSISINSVSPNPVQVFQSEQALEIYFRGPARAVVISVEGNSKTLYQQNIDTGRDKQVFIDLSAFESGNYTLKLINDKAGSLTGEFIK